MQAPSRPGCPPVQVKVIPISEKVADYAKQVTEKLDAAGVRVENDLRPEKMGYKIREAQLQKIPYMLVVGEKEAQAAPSRSAPATARITARWHWMSSPLTSRRKSRKEPTASNPLSRSEQG